MVIADYDRFFGNGLTRFGRLLARWEVGHQGFVHADWIRPWWLCSNEALDRFDSKDISKEEIGTVSGTAANERVRLQEGAYLRSATWLACAIGMLLVLLMPFAVWNSGAAGAWEVTIAAVVCLLPGLIALWFTSQSTGSNQVLFGILFSMGLRLLPPLVICLALSLRSTGAESFSFICYLLLFYMITLALETYLSVRLIQQK